MAVEKGLEFLEKYCDSDKIQDAIKLAKLTLELRKHYVAIKSGRKIKTKSVVTGIKLVKEGMSLSFF